MSIGLLIVGIAAAKGVRTMDTATAKLRTTSSSRILFILFSPSSGLLRHVEFPAESFLQKLKDEYSSVCLPLQ
jgi:hypothetical protein